MTRVVVDTNVLVSALLSEHGAEATVLDYLTSGRLYWCVSDAILAEYAEVLSRPKFARIPRLYINRLLSQAATTYRVVPTTTTSASPDEPDNRFLECAEASDAHYLVTGNERHFPKRWKETLVVNARELLRRLQRDELRTSL